MSKDIRKRQTSKEVPNILSLTKDMTDYRKEDRGDEESSEDDGLGEGGKD